MWNFIQGDKFKTLADWFYVPGTKKSRDDYDNLQNTLDWNRLKDGDVIYTHTHYYELLFEEVRLKKIEKKFKLITHNSDVNVNCTCTLPDNVIVWYAQNVNVKCNRIISIPIGLENDRWFKEINKKEKIQNYNIPVPVTTWINKVYMNHNIFTNPVERLHVYSLLENKPYVTAHRGKNGRAFDEYIYNMKFHKFMICPNGNGIDTHRIWEALYIGTIPIVKRDINNSFYEDLPICYVDEWDEISEIFLDLEYDVIKKTNYNLEKLQFDYWKKLITGK